MHASTQTDNRTPEKVKFLQDVGFSQVVLARELSLAQIHEISAATNVQLEFFIHGALCVSYSGQCNISHARTGSANRGECAQLCRLPCSLQKPGGEVLVADSHLLSLKDMDQTDNLEALIEAGIRSFKIEGRLKGLDYVKNVTAWYRQKLDAILDSRSDLVASSAGRCSYSFTPDPKRASTAAAPTTSSMAASPDRLHKESEIRGRAVGPGHQSHQGWHRDRWQACEPQQRRWPWLLQAEQRAGRDAPQQSGR